MKPEYILCAAVEVTEADGMLRMVAGHRHNDCIRLARAVYGLEWPDIRQEGRYQQGFLTSTRRFVDRREAWGIAVMRGQVTAEEAERDLYSEDLY